MDDKKLRVSQNEKKIENLQKKLVKLNDLKNTTLESDVEKLEFILPSGKNVPLIFYSLDELAAEVGVSYLNLSLKPGVLDELDLSIGPQTKASESTESSEVVTPPSDIPLDGLVNNIEFSITFFGPKENIMEYLKKILNNAPIIKINKMSLSDGGNGIISTTIGVTTFFQPLPTTLGNIDSPIQALTETQSKTATLLSSFSIFKEIPPPFEASSSSLPLLKRGIFH